MIRLLKPEHPLFCTGIKTGDGIFGVGVKLNQQSTAI
jgi:hypothetical protein